MATANSYDEFVYPSYPYQQTHPSNLATVARLFGLSAPPPESCRVLELGCAGGGNLLPMAEQFPNSAFIGIDLSARQIEIGQAAVRDLGLSNLSLRHGSILDVSADWGRFDYILCHGVYSWVPDEVRDKILTICRENLAPHGVAYVSYNTYPGWHMRGMLREIMCFHAARFGEPREQVQQARALLAFLAEASSGETTPYGLLLRQETRMLAQLSDSYLFHEHLEEHNSPCYFFEFAQRAREKGLQYLGDAAFATMLPVRLPPKVAETLRKLAGDVVQMEQYLDFVRNRTFRMTLLCNAEVGVTRTIDATVLQQMHFLSAAARADPKDGAAKPGEVTFQFEGGGGAVTSADPVGVGVLDVLGRSWPASVPYDRLAADLIASGAVTDTPQGRPPLLSALMQLVIGGAVGMSLTPSRCVNAVSERPAASPLARYVAAREGWAPTLRHGVFRLDGLARGLIEQLDGRRNHDGIVEGMVEEFRNKRLTVRDGDQPVQSVGRARELIAASLPGTLQHFVRKELLLG